MFHVVDKKTGKAVSTRFHGDPLVVFHHINAYEADGHVVLDLIAYRDSNLYDMFYLRNMRQESEALVESNKDCSPPVCQRFVLPLHTSKVKPQTPTPDTPFLLTLLPVVTAAVMRSPGRPRRIRTGDPDGHHCPGGEARGRLRLLPARNAL